MQTSKLRLAQLMGTPVLIASMAMSAHADESAVTNVAMTQSVVSDVQFVGLNRLTPDSLYPSLYTNVGDVLNQTTLSKSIESLYATGNFANIQVQVDNGKVIYHVVERPIIAEVTFEGNKLIPKEGLEEGLKYAGLSVGDVLKQSTLQNVANELQQQYISQGYYNSDIEVEQTVLDANRVALKVRFIEGKPAKVVDINVIGNKYFSNEDIKDVFAVKETSWTRLLSKSDRYAKEKLAASLENLKALYMNEGFVNFSVDNAILNINDAKDSVFIEVSVTEGEQHKFGEVNFLGNPSENIDKLRENVSFKTGDRFSQAELEATTLALQNHYGDEGYYFAQIRPVTRIDEANRTVNVDYYIDPARPVYVRRINFSGNIKTADEVLRREMRQLEGALASNSKIQSSRVRLMRTGYFKNVSVDIKPVPNMPDQIDVNFTVEEQPSGSSTIAAGYSQSGGLTFQLDFNQKNFLGTGNKVSAKLSRSETVDSYSLGYTDPYFTENGVAQSNRIFYKKTKFDDDSISNYVTDTYGFTHSYSYPIDENQSLSAGIGYDNTTVTAGEFIAISNLSQLLDDDAEISYDPKTKDITSIENDYNNYSLLLGWNYSSLDKPVFPTKGMSHSVNATVSFGDSKYQKLVYSGNAYFPLYKDFILRTAAKLGYGNDLPFYENFYAGGYGSVRGYEASSLGPKSAKYYSLGNANSTFYRHVGGNALATLTTELILPMPFKGDWADQVRPTLFFDAGQVFDTTGLEDETFAYKGKDYKLITQDDKFRYSAGAAITWYTPIGPISLSYAKPFNDEEDDKTETIQFQIGSVF